MGFVLLPIGPLCQQVFGTQAVSAYVKELLMSTRGVVMKQAVAYLGLGAVYMSLSSPAFAYLDGATGSMLLQALIGGAATVAVVGRNYIAKAKELLSRKTTRK